MSQHDVLIAIVVIFLIKTLVCAVPICRSFIMSMKSDQDLSNKPSGIRDKKQIRPVCTFPSVALHVQDT